MQFYLISAASELAGIATILISVCGIALALTHFFFFGKSKNLLANKVKYVFLTDASIYLVTILFGLWSFLSLDNSTAVVFQYIRIPILILNIWASVRLYKHYKELK